MYFYASILAAEPGFAIRRSRRGEWGGGKSLQLRYFFTGFAGLQIEAPLCQDLRTKTQSSEPARRLATTGEFSTFGLRNKFIYYLLFYYFIIILLLFINK